MSLAAERKRRRMAGSALALLYAVNSISLETASAYWQVLVPGASSAIAPLAVQTALSSFSAVALGRLMQDYRPEKVIAGAAAAALFLLLLMPADTQGSTFLALGGFAAAGLLGGASYMILWTAGRDSASPEENIRSFAPILFFGAFATGCLALADAQLSAAAPRELPQLFRTWLLALAGGTLLIQLLALRDAHPAPATESPLATPPAEARAPFFGMLLTWGTGVYAVMVLGKMIAQHHLIALGTPPADAATLLHLHRVAMFGGSAIPFILAWTFRWDQIAAAGLALYLACFSISLAFPGQSYAIQASLLLLGPAWSMAFIALLGIGHTRFFRADPARFGLFSAAVFPIAGSTTLLHEPLYRSVGWTASNMLLLTASAALLVLIVRTRPKREGALQWIR